MKEGLRRVVVADDNPSDRVLTLHHLRRHFAAFEAIEPRTMEELQACLAGPAPEVVITDYDLRWIDGLTVLRRVREVWPDVVVVMLTGTGSEAIAVEAMKLGLDDYVLKTERERARLVPAILAGLERRRQLQALRESEAIHNRLLGIIEATSDIVWTASAEGSIYYLNCAGRALLQIGEEESLQGLTVASFHEPDERERVRNAVEAAKQAGTWSGEAAMRTHRGEKIPVSEVIIAHRNAAGEVAYISSIARDIRPWKNLQEQLRQSQKMEAIGQLAGGVAHDFNNNLTVILSGLQTVLDGDNWTEEQREAIRAAMMAAERAAGLTRQLLTVSRRHVLSEKPVDLNRLVSELTRMLRRVLRENIAFTVEPAKEPAWILADEGMVEQVVMNLVVNARDAMTGSGSLTLRIGFESIVTPPRSDTTGGKYVTLRISDTGVGMPPEVRSRIFEPFFTTKPDDKGTGLGLATVQAIVQQHGGWIDVESEVGKGSTFVLFFPASAAPAGAATIPEAGKSGTRGGTETVLIVEDDPQIVALIETALSRHGYRTLRAGNGVQARELWREHWPDISLVLSDAVLPGAIGGIDFVREAGAEKPSLKSVIMSGYNSEAVYRFLSGERRSAFLQKPFTLSELLEAVRQRLDVE